MWFERFLNAIDASWIGDAVERRLELVRRTDPQNIYVENIRSFFRVPFKVAKLLCEVAVRDGIFRKKIGYLCPKDKNIVGYAPTDEEPPKVLVCRVCEAEGEEKCEFHTSEMPKIEVYSLVAN